VPWGKDNVRERVLRPAVKRTHELRARPIVLVMIAGLTIAGHVAYCLLRCETDKARLDEKKDWLAVHNNPVMSFQCLVLGARPIADGVPPLT
jgi:hypothetical protein